MLLKLIWSRIPIVTFELLASYFLHVFTSAAAGCFDGNQQLADAISSIDHESLKAYLDDMLKKAKNQYLLILSEGRFKEPATTSDEAS